MAALEHCTLILRSFVINTLKLFSSKMDSSSRPPNSQLIISVNDWARAINSRKPVDVTILDFSKAFDIVAHEHLKSKLRSYGIADGTLLWISSFLEGRKQRVVVNGTSSKWTNVQSGVPQGIVLGPLLFLLFINDKTENITSEIRLFADDCILYRTISSPTDADLLQKDLDMLTEWEIRWQMSFNHKK